MMAYYSMQMWAKENIILNNIQLNLDTYSGMIWVDNICNECIYNRIKYFEGQVIDYNRTMKGFGEK